MPTVDLSLMDLEDLDAAALLYQETFNGPPWNEGWGSEAARDRLKMILLSPNGLGVLASQEGTPIGFAIGYVETWVSGSHFQLKEMCTARAQQRQGVGSFVLEFLLRTLKERGVVQVFCETRSGVPAEAFFRGRGFRTLNVTALGKRL